MRYFFNRLLGLALVALWVLIFSADLIAASPALNDEIPQISAKNVPEWNCTRDDSAFVLWKVKTGSRAAAIVSAGDRLLVGTQDYQADEKGNADHDRALVQCFQARDGKFLWRTSHERLARRINDIPGMPIMSRPAIDGKAAYYVSNRGELLCVAMNAGRILWKLDMVAELGVNKIEAPDIGNPISSPLVVDDLVYCVTGNGGDFQSLPAPDAPSFIAVNKRTGKLAWSSNAPGKNIVYGQWSSPALIEIDGRKQIIFPGGDGFLYGFEPLSGKMLWKIDLGGVASPAAQGLRGMSRRNFFVAAPTVAGNTIYVGLDSFPENTQLDPRRPLYAVELAAQGGVTTPHIKWQFDHKNFNGTTAAATVADGKVYICGRGGCLFALDAATGKPLWMSDLGGTALFFAPNVSGLLYQGTSDGDLFVFALGPKPRCLGNSTLGGSLDFGSVIERDGRLYAGGGGHLYALKPPTP